MSRSVGDETGSDVELNRIVADDVILKTKEVSVDSVVSAPGRTCGGYDRAAERRWAKDTQGS